MPRHFSSRSFIAAVVAAAASTVSAASVLVSNLDQPFRAETPITNPEFWGAQSFNPGTESYLLDSIRVPEPSALLLSLAVLQVLRRR